MGQFTESGEGTDVWGLGRDGTRERRDGTREGERRDGEGCEGGRRDGAGTRLEKGALVEHSQADFCVPTLARLTAPPKCLSSRSSRTTRTSRGTRLSTAGVVVRLLFEPPAQRAQLTGTWHRRGKDRLLRAQASRVPGQEQVQLAQVQIGRSHHEQGHHRPGAFSLHPLAQPASPAVPSRASKLTSERLPLRSCTPSSRVTSFLPPPTPTSSPATVSSTVLPTGLPVRSFALSLLSFPKPLLPFPSLLHRSPRRPPCSYQARPRRQVRGPDRARRVPPAHRGDRGRAPPVQGLPRRWTQAHLDRSACLRCHEGRQ